MNELGERYSYAEMYNNAYTLFSMASKRGHKVATYNKIWCMYYGYGTEQNYNQAFIELKELIEKIGLAKAELLLGKMYYEGKGTEKDYNKAFETFSNIEEFNAEAQYYLGEMYLNGYGVEKDEAKAMELFTKSANRKCKKAIEYLTNK